MGESVHSIPLLSTKLFIPPPRELLVPRPLLVERLIQGLSHPLTLISAPAGSGKTTLVAEWRASAGRDIPLAWLSLDRDDNDPVLFMAYLFEALRFIKPDLPDPFPGMLQPVQALPLQPILANLINDLEDFPGPFVLALDDYHVITNGEVHAILTYLIEHQPAPMHLLILSQSDPPLPLARLRARNQLVELRAGDLRFTPDEAGTFFRQSMGLNLSTADVAVLEQQTEGWVAGMQLAGLALHSSRTAAGDLNSPETSISGILGALRNADSLAGNFSASTFTGSHPYVVDYLSAEVLARQPEDVRDFLLDTSILDRMTAELCDVMLERNDSREVLQQLERANLFLIPLDGERRWYRYHHLFAELLRSQLQATARDRLPELHRRAAGWYEKHGFTSEAISHALAADDLQAAARMIENNAIGWLLHGDNITLLNAIDAVKSIIPEHPWLGIYRSWAFLITGDVDSIEPLLRNAEESSASRGSSIEAQEMGYHIAAIRAFMAGRRGRNQEAVDLMQRALERVPEGETAIRNILLLTLGDACLSLGNLDEARSALEELDRAAGSSLLSLLALSSLGVLYDEQGELHRAADTFQAVISRSEKPDGRKQPMASVASLGLAGLEYEWNNLDAAERYAEEALELGVRWGHLETLAKAHLTQARIKQAAGDMAGTHECLRQSEGLARGQGVTPWTKLRIEAFRIRLALAQGQLEPAIRWASEHPSDPDKEIAYNRQIEVVAKVRILLAQKQPDAALILLDRLLDRFGDRGQTARTMEFLLLKALALAARRDIPAALSPLARALTLGEPEGFMRIFLDEGNPMMELLRHAGSRGIAPKYVARLLAAENRATVMAPASRQPLIEPLTERELEVLRLISQGFSNQAIADRLVVALGTVKTHTASLYRKLDVSSRTQAVARASELGLL